MLIDCDGSQTDRAALNTLLSGNAGELINESLWDYYCCVLILA